jgi:hypothetical protein
MTRSRLLAAVALLVPAALGLSATQARADGETISLVQNDPAAVAGRATNFTASGSLNPADTMFGFDIYVFLKNPDRDPTCAATADDEGATAAHSGGNESWVSPATGFEVGMGPAFSQPFKVTFTGSGDYLLCGYVNGDFSTFATAQLQGVVQPDPTVTPVPTPTPAPAPPTITTPALPAAVRAPWITRHGHVLTCHAGSWSNAPTRLSYRWHGKGRSLGSRRTLTVRRSLRGRTVTCRVTAANAAGRRTATSKPVRAR